MPSFCMTGNGQNRAGGFMLRADIIRAAEQHGWYWHDTVGFSTDYLVATRTDTTKACNARSYGTRVITYPEFWALLDRPTGSVLPPRPIPSANIEDVLERGRFGRPATPRPSPDAIADLAATEPPPPCSLPGERIRKINV
jgi:hypothetical protein